MSCQTDKLWRTPPDSLHLHSADVHLWRASLNLPASRLLEFRQYLSSSELRKANRFHFQIHRDRYIARHAILRSILGSYLEVPPAKIVIENRCNGKPELSSSHDSPLTFNLSSSDNTAIFAIAYKREIGVDIERINPAIDSESVSDMFFSPLETAVLHTLPADMQLKAFFDCWTRKEAYIKALGTGLSLALNSFDVSLDPCKPAALLGVRNKVGELNHWFMESLDAGAEYASALVVENNNKREELELHFWQWH